MDANHNLAVPHPAFLLVFTTCIITEELVVRGGLHEQRGLCMANKSFVRRKRVLGAGQRCAHTLLGHAFSRRP